MKTIALCAEKQAGKNTLANFAAQELLGRRVEDRALAQPLKGFCQSYLGLSEASCNGTDAQKNAPVGSWGQFFPPAVGHKYGKGPFDPITGREILQVVGTDIFRTNFKPTFWLDLMVRRTIPAAEESGVDVLFITDVRFRNEVEGLKAAGAKLVRLYRGIKRENSLPHPSELEMATIPVELFDYVIPAESNTTMEVLRESTRRLLKAEGLLQ